ncbi:hypothetical protein ES703_04180 [subsurface metagenome]|nr:hypothetical protein [bacterium]
MFDKTESKSPKPKPVSKAVLKTANEWAEVLKTDPVILAGVKVKGHFGEKARITKTTYEGALKRFLTTTVA